MTRSIWISAAFTLARLPLAARLPLCPDETYYWLWSTRPAWSYFDHPPMVAWLIAGSTALFGRSELAVRLPALLAGFVIPVALAWAARELAPAGRKDTAAVATCLLAAVMPLLHAGSVIVTPDSPAAAFWAIALAAVASAHAGRPAGWYAAGAAFGLALLSKYTAVLFGGSIALWLLADPKARQALRTPAPWIAGVIASALFVPVVLWNASHGWVSFLFQIHHGTATHAGGLRSLAEYLGAQLAILTPMLAWLVAERLWRGGGSADRSGSRLLGFAIVPTFALFALLSLKSRPEANWPAYAYLAAAVVAGLAMADALAGGKAMAEALRRGERGPWLYASTVLAGAVASILVSIQAVHPFVHSPKDRLQREFSGWRERAEAAVALRPDVLLGDGYPAASELAYYGGRPSAVAWVEGERRSMFNLWQLPAIPPGGSAAYVSAAGHPVPDAWAALFDRVESLPLAAGGSLVRLSGYHADPAKLEGLQ